MKQGKSLLLATVLELAGYYYTWTQDSSRFFKEAPPPEGRWSFLEAFMLECKTNLGLILIAFCYY